MPDWLEWVLGLSGAGAAGNLAPRILDYFREKRGQDIELKMSEMDELRQWRGELIAKQAKLEETITKLQGDIDLWQQKFFDVATQNELLKRQIAALTEQNLDLKRMTAALEDENQALQKKLMAM